jgi:acetyl esterase/lipase
MELMTVGIDGANATPRTRSAIGSRWQRPFAMPEMRLVQAPGDAGPIDVWIASPAGTGDKTLPAVVDVHGGPLGAWAPSPHIEVILLAAAGYRVILPNIRGPRRTAATGSGRSSATGVASMQPMSTPRSTTSSGSASSMRPARRDGPQLRRVHGRTGSWGRPTGSRRPLSENGVTNQVSSWANSDGVPSTTGRPARRSPPEVGVEKLWRQSPLRNVADVRTPLLILQAEADRRCPAADNEQFFVALRQLGRTVEYVLYPDEYHVFASSGRPGPPDRPEPRIIDWFDRYLR